jgi:hypothetical protein
LETLKAGAARIDLEGNPVGSKRRCLHTLQGTI